MVFVFGISWNRAVLRPNVVTLKGVAFWDFTGNHEAAGSHVWLKACAFVIARTTVPTLNPVVFAKRGATQDPWST